jgi:hypothetical protein
VMQRFKQKKEDLHLPDDYGVSDSDAGALLAEPGPMHTPTCANA